MRLANPSLRFSPREQRDLWKAWVLTSIAFAVFFVRAGMISVQSITTAGFLLIFGIAASTAGVGFIVHEICHKLAAHHYRVHGEFRANNTMLFVSIFVAMMGWLIAAPGAVYMTAHVTRRQNGVISAAGPVSNLILGLLFLPLIFFPSGTLLVMIGKFGLLINGILGAFNMIPFLGLDGSKVWKWSKPVYFMLLIAAVSLAVVGYGLF